MIYIIGVGSHAQVIYSILLPEYKNEIGFVSYGEINSNDTNEIIDKNYYGSIEKLDFKFNDKFVIGIGDNNLRMIISKKYKNLNYINAIHKNSFISSDVKIGTGNVICSGVSIQTGSMIENHNIINTNSGIDHHNKIHNFCHIAPNCAICGNVEIFDNSFIGVGSSIIPNIKIAPFSFIKAQSLIKESSGPIPIFEPYIKKYKNSAIDAIESGWISSQGKYIKIATEKLKEIISSKHVLLVNNGTSATHCLLLALRYKYPEIKKIYVPNNVYSAVWNTVLMEYKLENIEVLDIDLDTFNMKEDENYISSLEKNSCLFIVHNLGNIIDVDRIKKIRPDLILIEDNCEGFLGKYNDKYTGTSDSVLCSSISFFANKIITGGECGAFLTNDQDIYKYISKIINQGNTEKRYITDVRGYNYRCNNISAALLYDQLNDINHIIKKRENIFNNYDKLLQHEKIKIFRISNNCYRSCWIYSLRIIGNESYEKIDKFMKKNGIDIRPFFYSIKEHKHLSSVKFFDKDDQNSKILSNEVFMIPSSSELSLDRQQYISNKILEYIELSNIKKYYLTFINKKYQNEQILNRIRTQTDQFNFFDEIVIKNEEDISDFYQKHKLFFEANPHGFGVYMWKPKIILDFLNQINDDDILIYNDAGIHMNIGGIVRFNEYINYLTKKDIVVFGLNDGYKPKQYVKMDAIMYYYPEFIQEADIYHYAGLMILKKTDKVLNMIKDWLMLCENYHFLNQEKSIKYPEDKTFIGNDFDNALFNLCLCKYKNHISIYPDETNVYDSDGRQNYKHCNWGLLSNFPFHYRRDFVRT